MSQKCYCASDDSHDIYFRPEPKASSKVHSVWHVKEVKHQFAGDVVCRNLLFLHAITGCDTTSRLYGVGKATALKKLKNAHYLMEQAKVFGCRSTVSDIVTAGEKALVILFGGKPGISLNKMMKIF